MSDKRHIRKPKHIIVCDAPRLLREGSGRYNPDQDPDSHNRRMAREKGEEPRLGDNEADHGYTSNPAHALYGAGEAIRTEEQVAESLKARLHDQMRRRRAAERKLREEREQLDGRLEMLRALARESSADVDSDIRVIQRRIDAIERKIRKAA